MYANQLFAELHDFGEIENSHINEASGICPSKKNSNVLWIHNDSGDHSRIFAVNFNGEHLAEYYLSNSKNRDWEDIAIGPGPIPGESYLYVGDIGDNLSIYGTKYIYRFIEPTITYKNSPIIDTLFNFDVISYQYENGKRDAETLMIDPWTNDIYVVSKREKNIQFYILEYPQNLESIMIAKLVGEKNFYPNASQRDAMHWITAGDISFDGYDILIKSYIDVFYFSRDKGESIIDAILKPNLMIEYTPEVQGEAICWEPNKYGYFTVSEEKFNNPASLFFYPKKIGCIDSKALNYNPYATIGNRSCIYEINNK